MDKTIDVLCFGAVSVATNDTVDIDFGLVGENEDWYINWLLSASESRQLRKALKKAEKAVEHG